MNNNPITFCISVFNENLNYLKKVTDSIYKYSYYGTDCDLILYDEHTGSISDEYRQFYSDLSKKFKNSSFISADPEMDQKKLSKGYYSGIGGGMNFCADKVKTDYIFFLHADMFCAKNFDLECHKIFEKYPNEKLWVNPQRFQPNLFNEESRPGTLVFPYEEFGYKHDNFQEDYFIQYAEEFSKINPNIEYEKGEGVSGMIKKKDWEEIGGNDPIYRPAYWEDADLFLRCQLSRFKFVITSNAVIFHFGSRSANSNFPSDDLIKPGQKSIRSERSKQNEARSAQAFWNKWGFWPVHNQHQFVTFPQNIDKSKYMDKIKLVI